MNRHWATVAVGMLHSAARKMRLMRTRGCRMLAGWSPRALRFALVGCTLAGAEIWADAPLLSPRSTFFIPFTVDVPKPGQAQPQEVHLYVSGDAGQSWHFYQRQKPDAGRFIFNAGQDGELWFAVKTVEDPQNAVASSGHQPELKVVVDTHQPALNLEAAATPAGEIEVRWETSDPQLDPVTFRLEYKPVDGPLWQPIGVPKPNSPRADFTGQHRWRPPASLGNIQIRAEVSDRCGNVTSITRDLQLSSPSPGSDPATIPSDATYSGAIAQVPTASPPMTEVAALPSGPSGSPQGQLWPAQPAPVPTTPHQSDSEAWTAVGAPTAPVPSVTPQVDSGTVPPASPLPTSLADSATAPAPIPSMTAAPAVPPSDQNMSPELPSEQSLNAMTADVAAAAIPANLRTSNSRRFELDYIVETAVEVGVQRVELWYTKDQGHSWTLFGEDADRQTPFLVEMVEDGVFGYKIVAQSNHGISAGPPKPNTPADIWIRVDATRPAGRLTAARFGRGDTMGTLQIYWETHDDHPAPQPVTLLYGDTAHGPWRVIADGLDAEGRYDWRVGENVPAEIFLRLEVRDQAGNLFDDTLRDPIASNGLAPQSRIRGIRPAVTE